MENKRLKLPTGISTFEEIRTDGYVYVDKTQYLVHLIDTGKIYFLARPRRFGKSLTVSTFEALFSGRKELFMGLHAEEFLSRPEFKPSPVISLDMSKVVTGAGLDGIRESMVDQIKTIANQLDVSLPDSNLPGILFNNLIINTYTKHNQKVVVLIDEYDAPYTEFVNDTDMANDVRTELRNCYKQMKANDRYIRFIFLTGISKFARFGVFSTLNTTTDISLMPEYAGMCGYSEDEIIRYFPDYLDETAKSMDISTEALIEKMRYYYDGFCFDRNCQTRLYNPFSTLAFLGEKDFADYWVETGQSKIISDYMKNQHLTVAQFRNFSIPASFARSPGDVDTTPPEGFLYQCGYLTLSGRNDDSFFLDYPNTEVLNSMSALVVENILQDRDESFTRARKGLLNGLESVDYKKVVNAFNRLLACIPYDDYKKTANEMVEDFDYDYPAKEWTYRSMIISFLHGCGLRVLAEMHTNKGRADIVIFYGGKTWVIELKVSYKDKGHDPATRAEEALMQINTKNYAAPYPDAICVGMAIDDEKRLITQIKTNASDGISDQLSN